jgi:hypothetical protein
MRPICIHANSVQWQQEYLPRFMAGFKKHGHEVRVSTKDEADPEAVNVVFANNSWTKTVHACKLTGIPLLTVNRCFFGNRFDMVSIGWGGFNGDADFCLDPFMPDTRWKKHGFDIPHWLNRPGYILIICLRGTGSFQKSCKMKKFVSVPTRLRIFCQPRGNWLRVKDRTISKPLSQEQRPA